MSFFSPVSPRPDSAGMWEATGKLPEQIEDAVARTEAVPLDAIVARGPVSDVVVCGMGGSGIAGDVLAALAFNRLGVPVTVVKGYRLPAHVGSRSLVFAVSCSGDTEETVDAAADARRRGAIVVTVSGSGALAAAAAEGGEPLVPVPSGIPQPRAALGALAVPPLVVLERLGLWEGVREQLRAAADELAKSRDSLSQPDGIAGQLARGLGDTIPLVHGASGPTGVAAMRWKTQINENAKSPAFWSVQPELSHNEVAGWGQRKELTRSSLTLVALRYAGEHPQVARRFTLVEQVMDDAVSNVMDVRSDASSDVSALFDLALLGDFVSLHLAARRGVDPGPVPVLANLKARLGPPWSS
ncbi:MAG: bifunctional phosphoglucose/phosphomannose isomerase [Acidimicrobiales bacterium]